jgi:glycosyltransferase involved in cell wall biosynthesis
MQRWAEQSDRLVVVSDQDEQLVQQLLPASAPRVAIIGNGVDSGVFTPQVRPPGERLGLWRRWLVDEPRGWRPGGGEGSIAYSADDLSAFSDERGNPVPVVVFAGRFMRFKRLQLLIEAHHAMQTATANRSVLVVVGGFPGEWEGEHPYDTVQRLGAQGVFFAGWHDHDVLATMLTCSDIFAAPSVDEPFGLVYLEAMAAGLPAIATNTGGPVSFINVDSANPTGWLVPADDLHATAAALAEAVSNPAERQQRGSRAARFVRDQYSWATSAAAFTDLYSDVIDDRNRMTTLSPAGR